MTKWVLTFGGGAAEGRAGMAELLGGKGANLAEMAAIGLPVPPGFTITTEACSHYFGHGKTHPDDLEAQVDRGLAHIETLTGRRFGDPENPLLVSVRSGSRASMPGMMDTILNLGLNDETVEAIAKGAGDRRFAYDSYRRFIQMYADVVLGVDHHEFEDLLEAEKEERGVVEDVELSEEDLVKLVATYKAKVEDELGEPFPDDPREQLWGAIGAVFSSWMNPRAITYRAINDIPADWGTAVSVQAMVFGNMGETSATGVAFTRDPSTGEKLLFGEFLVNAQGEDVVAGLRTPQPLTEAARVKGRFDAPSLEARMPEVFAEFRAVADRLEAHYRDMQDIEFTIERSKLWMLQTRSGKRATKAAIKIAVDLVEEGVLAKEDAVMRVDPASLDQLLHPTLDPTAPRTLLTTGLPASPGAAQGVIAFSSEAAEAAAGRLDEDKKRRKVILVRVETSPEDIGGMHVAAGILTSRGGMTSHAAVVARGMGKPCVSGAGQIRIDEKAGTLTVAGKVFKAGDVLTIDGSTGQVLEGAVPMIEPELSGEFGKLIGWADQIRRMKVRANAETPDDARAALSFGAEGIGLARTEHMFFDEARIIAVREMILAEDDAKERGKALDKLLPYQRADFRELFEIMKGYPVAIRLLDPPLHEFLPHTDKEIADVAADMGTSPEKLRAIAAQLAEFNPMLGFRGCRLAIAHPEIADMQARAIFEAAVLASAANGGEPIPCEIMVPLVVGRADFDFVKARIDQVAKQVAKETGATLSYQVGAMIELPRAALRAGDIAETAAFFSFGTNDLTQTALGVSRDDAGPFLNHYVQKKLLEQDPFVTVDREGVGELVEIAVARGRKVRPDIKLGICGEHGGDPASIHFCEDVGLDYVSCSPFRVPIARLAAAQATLRAKAGS